MTKDEALQQWFNGAVHDWEIPVADGGAASPVPKAALLPAYPSESVPDDAVLPYLTYTSAFAAFDDAPVAITVNLWFRTKSEAVPNAAARELSERIGSGGVTLSCDKGFIWLCRGSPFVRPIPEAERYVKGRYVNVIAQYMTPD